MSQIQQDAAIHKWFQYIKDNKKRENEIGRVRENIKSGIISYPEWVKAALLINRIDQVNDREASIELLNTLNGKIHPRNGNGADNTAFIESLLAYYVGKHSKEDVNRFMSGCKPEKPAKKKVEKKEKAAQSKFFGNW